LFRQQEAAKVIELSRIRIRGLEFLLEEDIDRKPEGNERDGRGNGFSIPSNYFV
jgi:hypothetical protein